MRATAHPCLQLHHVTGFSCESCGASSYTEPLRSNGPVALRGDQICHWSHYNAHYKRDEIGRILGNACLTPTDRF